MNIKAMTQDARREAQSYLNAQKFFENLRRYNDKITYDEHKRLRIQAIMGDVVGAEMELAKLVADR